MSDTVGQSSSSLSTGAEEAAAKLQSAILATIDDTSMTRRAIETLLRETDSDGTSSSSSSSSSDSATASGGVGDDGSSSPLALSVEAALLLKAAHVSGAVRASSAAGGSWRDSPLAQLLPPALICLVEVAPRRFAALLSPGKIVNSII